MTPKQVLAGWRGGKRRVALTADGIVKLGRLRSPIDREVTEAEVLAGDVFLEVQLDPDFYDSGAGETGLVQDVEAADVTWI